jgi:predicted GNAT superfamily acetyltransferase
MDDIEIVPGRFMHSLQHNGACLLGAFDGERVVGFVFGALATAEWLTERIDNVAAARLQMYSVMMGVRPEYQSTGLGYRLKLAQREFALRLGIRLITWTFDPLESRNGYFNISKLGVVCQRYLRNFHGDMGGINAGLQTDRFHVDWWVTGNRVQKRLSGERAPLKLEAFIGGGAEVVSRCRLDDRGAQIPPDSFAASHSQILLAEVPADFQAIKAVDMGVAHAWRSYTRELFESHFGRGYVVTDFVRSREEDGRDHSYYVLTQAG